MSVTTPSALIDFSNSAGDIPWVATLDKDSPFLSAEARCAACDLIALSAELRISLAVGLLLNNAALAAVNLAISASFWLGSLVSSSTISLISLVACVVLSA